MQTKTILFTQGAAHAYLGGARACLAIMLATAVSAAIKIDTVFVADAGNPNDSTGHGGVSYGYHIGAHELTNAHYTSFLNAAAASDPNGLYNTNMGSNSFGGIIRSGSDGSYTLLGSHYGTFDQGGNVWE